MGAANQKKNINFLPHHLIMKIDLSGFESQRVTRAGLRELVEGIELLPCIRSLNLSRNGLTDDCDKEILDLFSITKLRAINLSFNNLKKLGFHIGKKMRDEITHINWIDMTMNDFDKDSSTVSMLVQGIKR